MFATFNSAVCLFLTVFLLNFFHDDIKARDVWEDVDVFKGRQLFFTRRLAWRRRAFLELEIRSGVEIAKGREIPRMSETRPQQRCSPQPAQRVKQNIKSSICGNAPGGACSALFSDSEGRIF